MAEARVKSRISLIIATLMIPWILAGGAATMTAVQSIADAFPHIPYSTILLVTTITNITLVPASVFSGIVAGRRVRYKTLMYFAGTFGVIAGIMPFFLNNFAAIVTARALFGLSLGIFSPLGNAYIFMLFEGDMRVRVMGLHTASMFLGSVVNTLLAGLLCTLNWHATFLVHLLAIAPLIVTFVVLPNPPLIERTPDGNKSRGLAAMPVWCYVLFGLTFLFSVFFFPMTYNMSAIITQAGLGDSMTTGIVLSCNTIVGAAVGLTYGAAVKRLGSLMLPISIALCAAGTVIVYFAAGLPLVVIGALVAGAGSASNNLAVITEAGRSIPREDIGAFSGFNMSCASIGMFCSTLYSAFAARFMGDAAKAPLILSCALLVVMSGALFTASAVRRKRGGAV